MKNHCTAAIINDVKNMVNEIRNVYKLRLEANNWLSPETRGKAVDKLNSLRVFVGGPAADDKPIIEVCLMSFPRRRRRLTGQCHA